MNTRSVGELFLGEPKVLPKLADRLSKCFVCGFHIGILIAANTKGLQPLVFIQGAGGGERGAPAAHSVRGERP